MAADLITTFSNQMADAAASAAPSVVQVHGRRRPASGVVYADGLVLTMARVPGREDSLPGRRHAGDEFAAELAGRGPATRPAPLVLEGRGGGARGLLAPPRL